LSANCEYARIVMSVCPYSYLILPEIPAGILRVLAV